MRGFWISIALGAMAAATASADDANAKLFQAIRNGDLAALKHTVERSNVESRDRRGATPLMHAAAFGNLETMKLLIDRGADVNARNDFDATALLWAARDPE